MQTVEQKLRIKLAEAKEANWNETIIFLSEKLVSISGEWQDVHELASVYHRTGQLHRALHLLKRFNLEKFNSQCQIITASCLLGLEEYQECILLLDSPIPFSVLEDNNNNNNNNNNSNNNNHTNNQQASSLFFLKGKAYDALEHKENASFWYKESIKSDIYNYDSFQRLIEGHFLTISEATQFLQELHFNEDEEWLKSLYQSKISHHQYELDIDSFSLNIQEYQLDKSLDVMSDKSAVLLRNKNITSAYTLTKEVYSKDPFHSLNLITYVNCLSELNLKNDLFLISHTLTRNHPTLPIGWYSVGCYYKLTHDLTRAKTFFQKAIKMNQKFFECWLCLGYCYSEEDESEQSIVSYRTAARLFPSSTYPWLAMGKEYLKTKNNSLAEQHLLFAQKLNPYDPNVLHELGVLLFTIGKYNQSIDIFLHVIQLRSNHSRNFNIEILEPTFFNLAHAFRKIKEFDEALKYYNKALSINSKNPSVFSAIGFTKHLMGHFNEAIEWYHKSLSIRPSHSFTCAMLDQALTDMLTFRDAGVVVKIN